MGMSKVQITTVVFFQIGLHSEEISSTCTATTNSDQHLIEILGHLIYRFFLQVMYFPITGGAFYSIVSSPLLDLNIIFLKWKHWQFPQGLLPVNFYVKIVLQGILGVRVLLR